MLNLSDRLIVMGEHINKGETMADIGTDHGFLALYLAQQRICEKVILCDISRGSLDKARKNVQQFLAHKGEENVACQFAFRLGDGLSVLEKAETDIVCIAGMGGVLISEILALDMEKTRSFNRFILQPRNGQGRLRYWLEDNGFCIEKNLLVREGKFICEIIIVTPPAGKAEKALSDAADPRYEFPEDMFHANAVLAVEFAKERLNVYRQIYASIGGRDVVRATEIERKIAYLERMLTQ